MEASGEVYGMKSFHAWVSSEHSIRADTEDAATLKLGEWFDRVIREGPVHTYYLRVDRIVEQKNES